MVRLRLGAQSRVIVLNSEAASSATYHYVVVCVHRDGTLHLAAQDVDGATLDEVWLSNVGTR